MTMITTSYSISTTTVNSFFAFEDFSRAFHRTSSDQPLCCPPAPPDPFQSESDPEPEPDSGDQTDLDRPCESIGFVADDSGLASCTEGLGFESSNMMVSDDTNSCDCCCTDQMINRDYYKRRDKEERLPSPEKKDFPPPLSSLRENGRRNFMLKPIRNNGRLEIVRVLINRPEILCASRQNGRLRLHLVVDDDEYEEEDDEYEEDGERKEEIEIEEERENEVEGTKAMEATVVAEEEREWKIPAVRRCYQREVIHTWGQQQHRCVTTM